MEVSNTEKDKHCSYSPIIELIHLINGSMIGPLCVGGIAVSRGIIFLRTVRVLWKWIGWIWTDLFTFSCLVLLQDVPKDFIELYVELFRPPTMTGFVNWPVGIRNNQMRTIY